MQSSFLVLNDLRTILTGPYTSEMLELLHQGLSFITIALTGRLVPNKNDIVPSLLYVLVLLGQYSWWKKTTINCFELAIKPCS